MKLLLDTHAALWWVHDDERMSDPALGALEDPGNEILLSAVSAWEISIKRATGKLSARSSTVADLLAGGARELPVTIVHAQGLERLPPHHSDPFDRLLVAQARHEGAVLVSADKAVARYGVPVLW